jgi:hypothetical protein
LAFAVVIVLWVYNVIATRYAQREGI